MSDFFFQKKAIDSKSVLRFLATKLSKRCYQTYKDICSRKTYNIPASKFDGLKGLDEVDTFTALQELSRSNLSRDDWLRFSKICQKKQKKQKKV